jgi:thiosulfate dehydrogenase
MKFVNKLLIIIFIGAPMLVLADSPKAPKAYPKGELGRMVQLGEEVMSKTNTHPMTKDLVGNSLQCKSCHLPGKDGKPGTFLSLGTFIGTAAAFPAYSPREKTVQTLQDRINNCFMRSMNGKRPIIDTEVSIAMAAYITWLSEGTPIKMDAKRPVHPKYSEFWARNAKKFAKLQKKATHLNYLNGQKLYIQKCSVCHGKKGAGLSHFPPLWGKKNGQWLSYNTGAGMSKLNKASVWIQKNMPLGQGDTLNDQQAADIALYISAQPRADFDLQKGLQPQEKMGYFNTKVRAEKHSVRSNFQAFGLNVNDIRGDKLIP